MSKQQVFIVGEQRSGSNLLRLMLNKSYKIVAPHPPHILLNFMNLLPIYGDLNNDSSFNLLIEDVCCFVEKNPVTWVNLELNRQEIFNRCEKRSLFDVFGAIMDSYANDQNAPIWVCKSMQNIRWISEIDKKFGNAKYIYLHRDPRDVTLSFMKAVVGNKHPYCIAKKWDELQKMCLNAMKIIDSSRFFKLKYEDLIENPQQELRRLCQFLEIDYEESMLKYHDSIEAQNTAKVSMLWANVSNPVMINNSKKYLHSMSSEDRIIVESVASDTMKKLGYQREYQNDELDIFEDKAIEKFNTENVKLQLHANKKINPDDLKRRNLQLEIIKKIESRLKKEKYA